jgi:hypothetical protein
MEKLWGKSKINDTFITGKKSQSPIWKRFGVHLQRKNPHPLKSGVISLYRKSVRLSVKSSNLMKNGIIEKRYGESLKNLSSKIPKGVYVLKIEAFSF